MALRAAAISKRTATGWILRDVSFTAETGTVFGIFGPPGAGKNTLLHILAGLEKPDGGTFSCDQTRTTSSRPHIKLVEPPEQASWLNLFKSGAPHRSQGERWLAAIEHALNANANVLLLNEAFCHLDRDQRSHLFSRIREYATTNNICVITATADFNEVLELCDVVAVMSRGEVAQTGSPENVYRSPASSLTASLTGRIVLIESRRLSSSKAEVPEFRSVNGSHVLRTQKFERSGLGAINQNVILGIRPEHISISAGASFPEDNLIKAVISDVRFLGPSTLVTLDADGLPIQALVMQLVGLGPGDECMVGLPLDRMMIFVE